MLTKKSLKRMENCDLELGAGFKEDAGVFAIIL